MELIANSAFQVIVLASFLNALVSVTLFNPIGKQYGILPNSKSSRPITERTNNYALNCYYERELTEDCQKNFGYYCTETGQLATTKPTNDEGCDTCKCIRLAAASYWYPTTLQEEACQDYQHGLSRDIYELVVNNEYLSRRRTDDDSFPSMSKIL